MRLLPERSASEDKTASDCISQFISLLGMTVLQLFPYMEVCPLIIEAATIRSQITAADRMPREISPPLPFRANTVTRLISDVFFTPKFNHSYTNDWLRNCTTSIDWMNNINWSWWKRNKVIVIFVFSNSIPFPNFFLFDTLAILFVSRKKANSLNSKIDLFDSVTEIKTPRKFASVISPRLM